MYNWFVKNQQNPYILKGLQIWITVLAFHLALFTGYNIYLTVLYAMLKDIPVSESLLYEGILLWIISPILITFTICFLIVAIPFGLLFEFGKYIKRKL